MIQHYSKQVNKATIYRAGILVGLITLLLGVIVFDSAAQTTITPVRYYTFNGTATADSTGASSLNFTAYGCAYTQTTGQVGRCLSLSTNGNLIDAGVLNLDTAVTIEFLMKGSTDPGANFNQSTFLRRADGYVEIKMWYAQLYFKTVHKSNSGSTILDEFFIDLNGIGRKSYGYYNDGNWHHMVFRFSGNSGVKEVWVDGQCPAGFSKTLATGYFENPASNNKTLWFNQLVSYQKYFGGLDEIAIYNRGIPAAFIYKHYLEAQQGKTYSYTNNYAQPIPAASPVSGSVDINEYPVGHPTPTTSAFDQLKNFPTPRYKPGHTLHPNFNWIDPVYFGGRFQPGVSDAQAVTNSVNIQTEMAKNFNYMLILGSELNFHNAWVNLANQNPQWKVSMITFRAHIGTKLWSSSLPNDHYLQNSSGQFIDANGNVTGAKYWRPTAPVSSYTSDGQTVRNNLSSALSNLTRNMDFINENGEVFTLYNNSAMAMDPVVTSAKNASGLNWEEFLGQKMKENDVQAYRDQFMTLPKLQNAYFSEYRIDGHRDWNFRYEQTRYINKPMNGQYYSTADFYPRWPNNWKTWQGPWHGLKWVVEARYHEIAAGDKLFSPYVAAGWDANPENDIRPAQWLGLLKCLGMLGAEFYYSSFFNEQGSYMPPNPPPYNPAGYAWQVAMPPYSQAITSRYEDILRNGNVLPGDMMNDYTSPTSPGYQFSAGDVRKVVMARKKDNANLFAITGSIQPNSNAQGNAELEGDAAINLQGQVLKFKIRRQGSTFIYDNTNQSAPVFFQLDGWHESSHPSRWSKDFNIEAELYDNTNATYTIKTTVPAGTPSGDYREYTSCITFPDNQATFTPIEYSFTPRDAANTTYYLWIKARSRNGQTTGLSVNVDNGTAKTIGCVTDTNWVWYKLDACSQQDISFGSLTLNGHTLRITPTSNKIEIDKIILTSNANLGLTPVAPACATGGSATITANGATTFCQGSSVLLTASSGTSYQWSNGATSQSITVNASGNYVVTVNNGTGCAGVSSPTTVTVNALPNATITPSGATTFCQGGNITLTASSGSSYLWQPGAQTTQSINVSTSAGYTVRVTNASGCSATSTSTNIVVNSSPTATATANGPTTFCQGGSVVLTASGGGTYQWLPGNQTASSITVSTAGTYQVKVTSANGCSAISNPIEVIVNALPTASITANGSTSFCQGGSVTLTSGSSSSYQWQPGGQTTQSITATTSGTYTVKVFNAAGCSATSTPTVVTVNTPTVPTITPGGSTTINQGQTVTLTSSAGASYSWIPNGQTTQSITVGTAGNYRVTVTDANGCSAISGVTTVTVLNTQPVTITPSGTTTFCQGDSIQLSASAGLSYFWLPGLQTSQSIYVSQSGTYTVQASNGTSAQITVNVMDKPLTPSITVTYIPNSAYQLTAYEPSAVSYLWSNGLTAQTITVSAPQTLTVRATNAFGCVSNLQTMAVTQPVSQPCAKANMLSTYSIIDVAATVSWNPAVTADSFQVSYQQQGFPTVNSITVAGNVSNVRITGLTAGATYIWSVRTFCSSGTQTSINANFTTLAAPLSCGSTPIALDATNVTESSARANWYATTAQQYKVRYRVINSATYSYRTINSTTYQSHVGIINLLPNTTYEWSVQATCNGNASLYSPPKYFTTAPICANLGGFILQEILHNKVLVKWNSTVPVDTVKVRYGIAGDTTFKQKSFVQSTSNGMAWLNNLAPSTNYFVMIRSKCDAGGRSAWSDTTFFTTLPAPVPRQDDPGNDMQLNAYPNPSRGYITYAFVAAKDAEYSVKVTDMSGRELLKKSGFAYQGENGEQLNLTPFTAGIYMLIVEQGPMRGRFKIAIE